MLYDIMTVFGTQHSIPHILKEVFNSIYLKEVFYSKFKINKKSPFEFKYITICRSINYLYKCYVNVNFSTRLSTNHRKYFSEIF